MATRSAKIDQKADLIWAIADKLTGVYKPHEYGDVVCIPSSRQLKKYKIFVLPGVYGATFLCRQSLLFMKFHWC